MTRIKVVTAGAFVVLSALLGAQGASASFGLKAGSVDATVLDEAGHFEPQAASHPFSVTTQFALRSVPNPVHGGLGGDEFGLPVSSEAKLRRVTVEAPPGLIGNPTATPRCTLKEFMGPPSGSGPGELVSACQDSTQVGIVHIAANLFSAHNDFPSPVYNLVPAVGQPALFGFKVATTPVFAVPRIRESDYGIDVDVLNIDETVDITGSKFTFWGVPADPAHDAERGDLLLDHCGGAHVQKPPCPSGTAERAFLTTPGDCEHGPFAIKTEVQSWPGETGLGEGRTDSKTILSHDDEGNPVGVTHCDWLPFEPTIDAKASSEAASSPSGLSFEMQIPATGLNNPEGLAQSLLRKAVVTLPDGFTLNPSAAEGMGVCTRAQFEAEKLRTQPGEACPNGSRLGSVLIDSPLLEPGELAEGSLYLAQPDDLTTTAAGAENPFDSLIALYLVARVVDRGVIVKSQGRVDPDPRTGQIATTFDELPQLPFSSFKLRFREGGRAPLITPSSCGEKATRAELYPYSDPHNATEVRSVSVISAGVGGGPCPPGGVPPFKPGFLAGSLNNNAKSFSPFNMRLTRQDGEQDMTKFSSVLPPGVLGKLAGVSKCSNRDISLAKWKTGREELAAPSCPASSEIGHVLVGAGAGSILTYVGGKIYLAGRYKGNPLSVVVVTPAVAGPFDVGTVITREALTLNPETAEVEVDGSRSDPIPHILAGIPLKVRDLRVYVDREKFILNPTSCDPSKARATLFGSYLDVFSPADDKPFEMQTRYQAANCRNLGFKPKLKIKLNGGTNRGDHPALKAVLRARPKDANIGGAVVTLPTSAFLDQAHIRTICTRVQFAAKHCPPGSEYGYAKAWTPLLAEPLQGPVYLRSSNHKLPDLVAHLQGLVDVDVVGRIDSSGGGLRSSFETVPDAPVSRFVLTMQGGNRGLVINSRNLCKGTNRAKARFVGQNGKPHNFAPVVGPSGCGGKRKR